MEQETDAKINGVRVIDSNDQAEFNRIFRIFKKAGYAPEGETRTLIVNGDVRYIQVMIRKEKKKDDN